MDSDNNWIVMVNQNKTIILKVTKKNLKPRIKLE